MGDNTIVHKARLHWILFFWPLVLLGACIWGFYEYPVLYELTLFGGLMALIWFFMMWITYQFSSLTIKTRQVIIRKGVLVRKTIDVPMNKIETIDISQTILGSLLHYGSLVITGTGGTRQIISYLKKPLTCRRLIEENMYLF